EAVELRRHLCDFLANLIGPADQEARTHLLGTSGQLRVDLFRTVSAWLPPSLSPLMAFVCGGDTAAAAVAASAAAAVVSAAAAAASHSPPMPQAVPAPMQPTQSASLSLSPPSAPLPAAADSALVEANLCTVRCLLALLASGPGLERDSRTGELGIGEIRLPRLTAWLDGLLACRPSAQLAQDTVCQLLLLLLAHDSEQDVRDLLDWLVHRCYTAPVGTPAYIRIILTVFTAQPDFPCYDTVMLCLAMLFSGLPDPAAAQQASHLFQLLYHRFYLEGKDASNEREAFYRRIPCLRAETLSAEFAVLHAQDLTMSVFSELTRRCEEARPPLKQIIFRLLLPWLRPIELSLDRDAIPATSGGYGSIEASEMILNNLVVLTHQIGDLFPFELEAIWQGLVRSSADHSNLKTIIRYILAVTSLSPDALLPTARRIAVYALRKEPRSTVDELLAELRCLDDRGSWAVERLPSRPYIKYSDRGPASQQLWSDKYATLRACPAPKPLDMPPYGGHFANLDRYLTQEEVLSAEQFFHCAVALLLTGDLVQDRPDVDWRGYSGPSRVELKRLPTLLHACVLAMDHAKPRVHMEARLVLLQLCTVLYPTSDVFRHALLSLRGSPVGEVAIKASPSLTTLTPDQSQPDQRVSAYLVEGGGARQLTELLTKEPGKPLLQRDDAYLQARACACAVVGVVNVGGPGGATASGASAAGGVGTSASICTLAELVQLLGSTFGESVDWAEYALVAGLSCASRHYAGRSLQVFRALGQPLSMARLGDLTQRLIETVSEPGEDQCYVRELLLTLDSCVRFANCSPASALHHSQQQQQRTHTSNSQSQSSTRTGTPGSGGDGSIMVKSTTELQNRQSPVQLPKQLHHQQQQHLIDESDPQQQHIRSTSYTAGISHGSPAHNQHSVGAASAVNSAASAAGASSRHHRAVTVTDLSYTKEASGLAASSGSSSGLARRLANQADERFSVLWWISVCLLESDVEHELTLSLRILGQLVDRLQEQHQPPRLRFEWPDYPGLVRLLGRACCPSAPALVEPAFAVMCRLPRLLMSPVTEPRGAESGFASLTLQLLPYLLLHYDNSPQQARDAAARLGTFGQDSWPDATSQLSVVLAQYSRNSFTRDAGQWCRCVCRYLCDAFPGLGPALVRQALGQLEAWPAVLLPHSQGALHALLSNVDLTEEVARPLVHILTRQIAHGCGDTMRLHAILKHLVFKSSSVPPASHTKHPLVLPLVPLPEAEPPRRELPGRTLNFTFDVRSEDQIGGAAQSAQQQQQQHHPAAAASTASMASAVSAPPAIGGGGGGSLSSSDSGSGGCGEKRSLASGGGGGGGGSSSGGGGGTSGGDRHLPQVPRVRIRLVALCAGYFGARAGLPKSPSVIFSQSTETIDRQGSVHSSSDTTSTNEQTDDLLLEDSSSSELRYYNIVGFIDDQLGFLNIEDPDSPTHPGHVKLNWGVGSVPIYSDSYGDAAFDRDAAASPTTGRRLRREESSSSSSDDEEEELVAALPQREPATGASLSPSSAPSTSPQEEPPGPGELEWQ
uniref:MOR2-PAG1_C domain-containing protein n=1 Tax=Macrostomum lignano TaxID=282301 RepID=A0A1I8HQR2_9PLAT